MKEGPTISKSPKDALKPDNNNSLISVDAPRGFSRTQGGVLMPNNPDGEVLKPTKAIITTISQQREIEESQKAEQQEEERTERLIKEYGVDTKIFNIPNELSFMVVILKSLYHKSNIDINVDVEELLRNLIHSQSGEDLLEDKYPYISREDLQELHVSALQLYKDFRQEFLNNPKRLDSFARLLYTLEVGTIKAEEDAQINKSEGKDSAIGDNDFLKLNKTILVEADRNSVAYIFAKGIFKLYVDALTDKDAQVIYKILEQKSDLHTDLFYLLLQKHSILHSQISTKNKKLALQVWIDTPPKTLINEASSKYASLAFTDVSEVILPNDVTNVGFEFEFLQKGGKDTVTQELQNYINSNPNIFVDRVKEDRDMTELITIDKGIRFDTDVRDAVVEFSALCERDSRYIALSNVHINLDQPGWLLNDNLSIFKFRKFEHNRLETNYVAPPLSSAQTQQIHEYSILEDQAKILSGLYTEHQGFLVQFIKDNQLHEDVINSLHDIDKIEAEFLITLSQALNKIDLIPRILRCYIYNALPTTSMTEILINHMVVSKQEFSIDWFKDESNRSLLKELSNIDWTIGEALASRVQEFSIEDESNRSLFKELSNIDWTIGRVLASRVQIPNLT